MKKILISIVATIICVAGAEAQIFYKISGNGLEKPSYLFGTHHLAPLSTLTENQKAMEALNSVSAIVTEIDMLQDPTEMQMAMMPFMMAPQDSTLTKILSPEDFAKADKVFIEYTGVPLAALDAFKPMLVCTNLSVMIMMKIMPEFVPTEQLDTYIAGQGKALGKKNLQFETAAQQAQILFGTTPISEQAKALMEVVNDPEKSIEMSKKLNEAYFSQDLPALLALSLEEEENPQFMEKLLDIRNADWLRQLPSMMKSDNVFVAVGALHLAGENGVVEGLRNLGYTVEAIR